MKYHQPFYKVLKSELKKQGYWKNKDRGGKPPEGNRYV